MNIPATLSELYAILDMRYKQIVDCDREMDSIRTTITKLLVDVELIKQTLRIIKWVACTTLAAVIVAIVTLIIHK
jgi:hypothetical protein